MPPKTVLVTGCSEGGAGAALAREFRNRGHTVFATVGGEPSRSPLNELGIHVLQLDVTSQSSIGDAVSSVRQITGDGGLDILINNAAVFSQMPLADVKLEDARQVFDANVFGVLAVTQAFLPLLIEAGGLVANVSSLSAILCPPWQGIYAASKAALTALGHTMRVEFAPLGVGVVTIISGGVDSPFKAQDVPVSEGSWYHTLAGKIEGKEQGDYKGMPTSEYAKGVADDLLRSHPKPMLWRGAFAWVAWVATWFGWVGMMDRSQISRSGLDKIERVARSKIS